MSNTQKTDAVLVRVYGTTGTMCAATKKCAHPVFVQAEDARQFERELITACDNIESAKELIRSFDAAIRKIAAELTGKACGGVDTSDEINPETGEPYGPGGHTGWLLASEARKLREERDRYKADSEALDWLLKHRVLRF